MKFAPLATTALEVALYLTVQVGFKVVPNLVIVAREVVLLFK